MKKNILLSLSLYFLVVIAARGQKFKPGIVAGAVASDLVGVDSYDNDFHKAGLTGGGSMNVYLSERNSFQFEILYTQKGSLQPPDSLNAFTYYQLKLTYIEVPLIYKHRFALNAGKKAVDRFAFESGLSFGNLTKIKQTGLIVDNSGVYNTGVYSDSQFRKIEVAANLGLDFLISDNFMSNVRFSNSLTHVVNQSNSSTSSIWYTFNKGHNVVFYFTLRYVFSTANKEG